MENLWEICVMHETVMERNLKCKKILKENKQNKKKERKKKRHHKYQDKHSNNRYAAHDKNNEHLEATREFNLGLHCSPN